MHLSSELYEKIFSSSQNLTYVMDSEGRYILVSQAGAKALGFAPNDMMGKTWQELNFSLDVMAPFDIKMRTVFASRSGSNGELLFPTTGGIRYFSYHIAPLQNGVGDIEGVVVTLLDITKRRRFEMICRPWTG